MTGAEKSRRYRERHPDRIRAASAAYRARNLAPTGQAEQVGAGVDIVARLEDYAWLRSEGHSIDQAAWRMRVNKRTAERYEARLRETA